MDKAPDGPTPLGAGAYGGLCYGWYPSINETGHVKGNILGIKTRKNFLFGKMVLDRLFKELSMRDIISFSNQDTFYYAREYVDFIAGFSIKRCISIGGGCQITGVSGYSDSTTVSRNIGEAVFECEGKVEDIFGVIKNKPVDYFSKENPFTLGIHTGCKVSPRTQNMFFSFLWSSISSPFKFEFGGILDRCYDFPTTGNIFLKLEYYYYNRIGNRD